MCWGVGWLLFSQACVATTKVLSERPEEPLLYFRNKEEKFIEMRVDL